MIGDKNMIVGGRLSSYNTTYNNYVHESVRQKALAKKENSLEATSIYRRLEVARMMLEARKKR